MKTLSKYITEAEHSKRILNPISWTYFISCWKNKEKIGILDKVDTNEYMDQDLYKYIYDNYIVTHPNYFGTNDQIKWYVICGNYKKSWTGFDALEVKEQLGKPENEHLTDNWNYYQYDKCILWELPQTNIKDTHWGIAGNKDMFEDLGLDINRL